MPNALARMKPMLPWLVGAAVVASAWLLRDQAARLWYALPMPSSIDHRFSLHDLNDADRVVFAKDLDVPWGMALLPDGSMLVTERDGKLKRVTSGSAKEYAVPSVEAVGEGGLLGVAVHPRFDETHWIYLYLTSRSGNGWKNRVERYVLGDDALSGRTTIIQDIPAAAYHDGGALAFGPDRMLYASTGDAGMPYSAQDRNSLAGKILRLKDDGGIPKDNPFGTAVWSLGHRNVQGMAWDSAGRMWATEHGRSGLRSGYDEINVIRPGANYGWPLVQGDERQDGMEPPVVHSGAWETWAPSGLAHHDGHLFFGGLRGAALYEGIIQKDGSLKLWSNFQGELGRVRGVFAGPDSRIYVATSNRDGRGYPREGDDKIWSFAYSAFTRN